MQSSPFSLPLLFFSVHSAGQLKEWQKKNECDREKFDFHCDMSETVQPIHGCVCVCTREKKLCYLHIPTPTSSNRENEL